MATSDSEDFESADEEWDEETETVPNNPNHKPSVKLSSESNKASANKLRTLSSAGDNDIVEETFLEKSFEKNMSIQENKPPPGGLGDTDQPSKDIKVDKHQAQLETSIETKSDAQVKCESDPTLIATEKPNVPSSDSKEVKDVNPKLDVCVPEAETDGWECENEELDELEGNEGLDEQPTEENANKEKLDSILNKISDCSEKGKASAADVDAGGSSGWGAWGGWGVSSLLSTATGSVSTISNQVSQGLSAVLESGLGVPDPEELARREVAEEKLNAVVSKSSEADPVEKQEGENAGLFGFGRVMSGVSSITKLVETAGSKVVTGGLDTLESIGKKTMEVLQEGDPGLRKKRALFSDKVVLSQVLREAKEKAEEEDKVLRSSEEARKVHFETLFDDFHGLVHLEALEMLSKQCSIKLQSVLLNTPSGDLPELQESLEEIKDLCQLPEEDDVEGASFDTLKEKLADVGKGLGVPVANEKLIKTWSEIHEWLQDCAKKQEPPAEGASGDAGSATPTAPEMHQKAIAALARLTAEAVEQFHKTAELLLVYEKRNPTEEAKILLDMTSIFTLQVSTAATVFSEHLNRSPENKEDPDTVGAHITNVFLEAANSSSYIQEAFQLLVPILQVGASSS